MLVEQMRDDIERTNDMTDIKIIFLAKKTVLWTKIKRYNLTNQLPQESELPHSHLLCRRLVLPQKFQKVGHGLKLCDICQYKFYLTLEEEIKACKNHNSYVLLKLTLN